MLRTPRPMATAARRALRSGPLCPPSRAISASAAGSPRPLLLNTTTRLRREAPAISLAVVCRTLYSTKHDPPVLPNKPDTEHEKELARQKLKTDPTHVSIESSYRQDTEEPNHGQRDVHEGVATDVKSVKAALSLAEVPREAYVLGLAGTIPYFATSLSTVFLTWNLRTQWPTDSNFLNSILLSHENATQLLSHLEVLQVGYGAAIISFLGAIHWGLEWAEKSSKEPRTRYRYAVGVLAPALAWPTVLLPAQLALTSQFALFTALYFVDARFTTKGWTPHWYGTYRFVLTAIVGGAIFVSLVFRSKGGEEGSRLSQESLDETMHGHPGAAQAYSAKWAKLEDEEREKVQKEKEEEEKRKKKEEEEKKKAEKKNKAKGKAKKDEKKKGDEAKASNEDKKDKDETDGDDNAEEDNEDSGDGADDGQDDGDEDKKDDGGDKKGDSGGDDSSKGSDDKNDKKEDNGDEDSSKGPGDKDSKKKDAKGDEEEGKGKKGKK